MGAARVISMTVLAIPALACAAWMILTLVHGSYLTTLVALGATVFWFMPIVIWQIMPKFVAWGTFDSTGTTIRLDKRMDRLTLTNMFAGAIALGLLAALGGTAKLDIPLPPDIANLYSLVFAGPAIACLGLIGVILVRPGVCSVRLTPQGFEFAEAFTRKRGAWSEVVNMTDEAPAGVYANTPIVMVLAGGETKMLKEAMVFTPNASVLRALVQLYWQHPECRGELTDGQALERLRSEQLLGKPSP